MPRIVLPHAWASVITRPSPLRLCWNEGIKFFPASAVRNLVRNETKQPSDGVYHPWHWPLHRLTGNNPKHLDCRLKRVVSWRRGCTFSSTPPSAFRRVYRCSSPFSFPGTASGALPPLVQGRARPTLPIRTWVYSTYSLRAADPVPVDVLTATVSEARSPGESNQGCRRSCSPSHSGIGTLIWQVCFRPPPPCCMNHGPAAPLEARDKQ